MGARRKTMICFDADAASEILFDYCHAFAEYNAHTIVVKEAGMLTAAATLWTIEPALIPKRSEELYQKLFQGTKSRLQGEVSAILSSGSRSDLRVFHDYLIKRKQQTKKLLDDTGRLFDECLKRSEENQDLVKLYGSGWSLLTFVAESAAAVVSVFAPPNKLATAVSIGGATASDAIDVVKNPDQADIVSWKGTGKVFFDEGRSKGLDALVSKGGYTLSKSTHRVLKKGAATLSLFFAWDKYQKNLAKFK